jgi:uncharacterized membrane protein
MWSFLAFQVAWAEEEIAVTSTEENQRDKRDSKFIEVDFPALYKEYKQNKAKMTDFAFKTWWESVNVRLEGTYVKGTAIVKNAKNGWTGLYVEMGTENESEALSVRLYLDKKYDTEVQSVLALEPGKPLTFTGKLDEITALWGAVSVILTQGTIGKENQLEERFIEVDFPALYKEYKQNKAKMTDFAFKTWWESVNVRLEGTYVKSTAIVKNVKNGWTGLYVEMGTENESEALSVTLYLDKKYDTEVQSVLALEPGKPLAFTGKLDEIAALWGVISVILTQGAISHEFQIE